MPKLTIQIRCRISPTRDDAGFVRRTIERTIHTMEGAGIAVDSTDLFHYAEGDPIVSHEYYTPDGTFTDAFTDAFGDLRA